MMPSRLPVANSSMRDTRYGKCASGNAVLGGGTPRLGVGVDGVIVLEELESRGDECVVLARCGGRAGITKPSEVWPEV